MDPERWQLLDQVFAEALERPVAEREAFVTDACGDDEALRSEVLELLAADDQLGQQFLERPVLQLADSQVERLAERLNRVSAAARQRVEIPPERVGRYRIDGLLGDGAMGRVYRAHDEQLDRAVALKLLHSDEPRRVRRFQQEARAQGRLEHGHICRVYDVGEADGRPYIAMQLINGVTLGGLASQLSTAAKVEVVRQAAEALQCAHDLGVIHRDIKPTNIMVETGDGDDEVKAYLLDFGIARLVEAPGLTVTGQVFGTPAFMAPEQVDSSAGEVDHRADVYSLGATLYALLAGRAPFTGASQMEILLQLLSQEPLPLRRLDPEVPAALEAIVSRCLDKKPERRYASARALADELQRFLAGEPIEARSTGPLARMLRKADRHRALTAAIATSVVMALALAGVLLHLVLSEPMQVTATVVEAGQQPVAFEEVAVLDGQDPALTPDGRSVVWVSADQRELWLQPIGAGAPRLIFESEQALARPVVSRDGRWIYFDRYDAGQDRVVSRVPVTGGDATLITRGWAVAVAPDGEEIACFNRDERGTTTLVLCRSDGTSRRALFRLQHTSSFLWSCCFTLDGHSVLVVRSDGFHSELVSVDRATGTRTMVTHREGLSTPGVAALPGGRAVWCGETSTGSDIVVGLTDLAGGGFSIIAPGDGEAIYSNPVFAPASGALSVCFEELYLNLASVSLHRADNQAHSSFSMLPQASGWAAPRVSPERTRLAAVSTSMNKNTLVVLDTDSGVVTHPAPLAMVSYNPDWSPDGSSIVFGATTGGQPDLWIVDVESGQIRRLTDSPDNDYHPCWHPNGRQILWISDHDGINSLLLLDLATGRQKQLLSGRSITNPAVSPDGRYLAYISRAQAGRSIYLYALDEDSSLGALLWRLDGQDQHWATYIPRFSPDGQWLGFDGPRETGGVDIFGVPVDSPGEAPPVRLTALPFAVQLYAWWDWMGNDRVIISIAQNRRHLLLLRNAEQAITEALGP